jgi:hypothetical protein
MIRTQNGLLLERMLSTMKTWDGHSMRYLFCYNGEGEHESYDCGCCLTWEPIPECNCLCHGRIEAMANSGDLRLLFTALQHHEHFPKFATSYDELESWRKAALNEGKHHFHNTNGRFSNYPQVVCSVCHPAEESIRAIFNCKTGELKTVAETGLNNEALHSLLYPAASHPRLEAGPEFKSGCTFHSEPETPQTPMPKDWTPGGCVS